MAYYLSREEAQTIMTQFGNKQSIQAISAATGRDPKTIRKVVTDPTPADARPRRARSSKLDPGLTPSFWTDHGALNPDLITKFTHLSQHLATQRRPVLRIYLICPDCNEAEVLPSLLIGWPILRQ